MPGQHSQTLLMDEMDAELTSLISAISFKMRLHKKAQSPPFQGTGVTGLPHRHRNRWTANSEVSYYMFILTT